MNRIPRAENATSLTFLIGLPSDQSRFATIAPGGWPAGAGSRSQPLIPSSQTPASPTRRAGNDFDCESPGRDRRPVVTVRGPDAWALLKLKAADDNGCAPVDHPGPRWSGYVHKLQDHPGAPRLPVRGRARALYPAEPDYHPRNQGRQVMMAIAGPEIAAGGASAPPALTTPPKSRTITNGVLAVLGGRGGEAS